MSSIITDKALPEAGSERDPGIVQIHQAHLQALEHSPSLTGKRIRTVMHLITWLSANGMGVEALDIRVLHRFLSHDCTCPGPHGYRKSPERAGWHLHQFPGFLMETGRARTPPEIETGGRVVESFLQTLMAQGCVDGSIIAYRKRCRHFIVWLYLNGIALSEVGDDVLPRFLSHDCTCVHPHFFTRASRFAGGRGSRSRVGTFIDYLIRTGIAPPRPAPAREQPGQHLAHFLAWLRRYRGIGEGTAQSYLRAMRVLLPHLGDDPGRYGATLIRNAVRSRLETASRQLVRREMSALRLYLRFLALEGFCRPGLAGAVPAMPLQRLHELPRHLPQEDIGRIIASCDQATPRGKRDRAMLLLLARLALRAGDVASLRLQDIDWDGASVRVCGKSRRAAVLPLPQDVGDAIRDYVLHARPAADTGRVFLRVMPPLGEPLASGGVSAAARSAIRRSGVKADGLPPAHVFRHSVATNLLRGSTPLEVISTLLRHQSVDTTAVYARVDVPMLLEVAQPWPSAAGEVK